MKFFAPLVVGVVAFLSSQVDANGVCYDPNHGTGMSASSVQTDMQTIASHGFDSVRTYISKFGNTEMGPIIAAVGLKAMLGVPYPQSDYKEQMEAAIKAAQAGGVYAIMVGNENLAGAPTVPDGMISVIQQIKSQVPSGVLVGTVQRNTEVINYQSVSGWSELVANCDLLGVNAHPFFNPNTAADNAIQVLNNQWQTMVSTFGSKLILTETGWPSSGSLMGNFGSVQGAETFYNAYQQWSSSMGEKFYFQMFDTHYRGEEFEKTFGVVTADAQAKFGMSVQVSVPTNQQQQQTPSTEAPRTDAPTYQQQNPSTDAPTYQQQTPSTDAPTYQQPIPVTEAPTQAPTLAPTQAPTQAPTLAPTEAPTQAPTLPPTQAPTLPPTQAPTLPPTEAPTAAPTPEATPAPTETPAIYQNSGSTDYNTTSGSNEVQFGSASSSSSVSSSGDEAGVVSGSSSSTASSKSSKSSENEEQQQQHEQQQQDQTTSKAGETEQQQTQQQTSAQQQDDTKQANTQSGGSGASTTVAFGLAGGACAALVAFGFIYQARKRAASLENAAGKRDGLLVTPMDNRCAL
ncbi:hypothetical protein PF005_g15077 [Phytophthora fragariae]|uniref:glucan endo-1,3-beta-D-glucosidase n=1 Tax=Phytophthora fragariae TaxID=53985 RepID=A0A6A3YH46_9STRA|nr:hypothetical protein PF003_g11705 [Phytophthora fragariae]KAE8933641.1 hypothetical protein PF009_g16354 [Phytophthora fragariae]KAE9099034.1 hypothetical protein PF010_g15341 [Phytophthora fragariae]KAE9100617.1 hypothetical protein PF007_g15441 [Phytophthora fragariae]KAE9129889.1 hypothetical protein PF006_g15889 [Phytophthora fragariae]